MLFAELIPPYCRERLHMDFFSLIDLVVNDSDDAAIAIRRSTDLLGLRGPHQETPLHYMVIEGSQKSVSFLHAMGASLDVFDEFGYTPLISAVICGNALMVETLLSLGADPAIRHPTEGDALSHACRLGNLEIIGQIIRVIGRGQA